MTYQEDIATLKLRIAKSESERDAWRAAGREEKYLESYFMVEALELQLVARLVRSGIDTSS
jgi:hypothetical protein